MIWLKNVVQRFWTPLPPVTRRVFLGLLALLIVLAVLYATSSKTSGSVDSDWLSSGSAEYASPPALSAEEPVPQAKLMVQVVGQVRSPGVYTLPSGSRVLDAVFAAGGFLPKADQSSINLARPLNDGEQILILELGSGSGSQSSASSKLVNLNLADAATLDSLPGIGPTLAQRIIDYRSANGGFRSFTDLGKVAGIGQSLLTNLKPLVTL